MSGVWYMGPPCGCCCIMGFCGGPRRPDIMALGGLEPDGAKEGSPCWPMPGRDDTIDSSCLAQFIQSGEQESTLNALLSKGLFLRFDSNHFMKSYTRCLFSPAFHELHNSHSMQTPATTCAHQQVAAPYPTSFR